jgi:hypothetical protein
MLSALLRKKLQPGLLKPKGSSLTHNTARDPNRAEWMPTYTAIKSRLLSPQQLDLLAQLAEFPLGRFLIANQGGLSGAWTYYIIKDYRHNAKIHPLESKLLQTPIAKAMRERYANFSNIISQRLEDNHSLCSVPCGTMRDVIEALPTRRLYPWLWAKPPYKIIGIDLDADAITEAKRNIPSGIFVDAQWYQYDLFQDNPPHEPDIQVDAVICHGLNFYQPDDEKVIALYKKCWNMLRADGTLATSALTPPPSWNMSTICHDSLSLQMELFGNILQPSWTHFRSSEVTKQQLLAAGFSEIQEQADAANIMPTYLARKL